MKSILLIGLGRFGIHMAKKLQELRHEVLAVDRDERKVNRAMDFITNVQIGDSTDEAFIESLGVRNFDLCIVAIGDDFQSSLETTALLKECGAQYVVSQAIRDVHAKFLLRNGADEVVYPEKEAASWAAVRYSLNHILDYIPLTPEYAIYEMEIPKDWIGRTVEELAVRKKYHFNILAVKAEGKLLAMPDPGRRFGKDEKILIMGDEQAVQRFWHVKG